MLYLSKKSKYNNNEGYGVNAMRVLPVFFVCLTCCLLSFPSLSFSGNVFTGIVVEQSSSKKYIQVKDSIYHVTNVWRDNGIDDPIYVSRDYLKIGSVVQIMPAGETVDYKRTKKVVLLVGLKKQEALASLMAD